MSWSDSNRRRSGESPRRPPSTAPTESPRGRFVRSSSATLLATSFKRTQSGADPAAAADGAAQNDGAGRVRVAVRVRPRLPHEMVGEGDFMECVSTDPEINRVTLRKNHWESEAFHFDAVFPEHSSQKRIYDTVAQPVVQGVMQGYNGTVLAYGQTGTGKTYTLGNMDQGNGAERGLIPRAVEDILTRAREESHHYTTVVKMMYFQLYLETVQDLLSPENSHLQIQEEPRTGEVMLPGATTVVLESLAQFYTLFENSAQFRVVANQKLNASSSRSHAVMVITVHRTPTNEGITSDDIDVMAKKGRLCLVDLAGSERINKSGSSGVLLEEAKSINLSLTTLGKCINLLASANASHVPYRESKLTRILKDSFGGSARTSLIVTCCPNPEHFSETYSSLKFGMRAILVENSLTMQEEVDYKLLTKKQQSELDKLTDAKEKVDAYCAQLAESLANAATTIQEMQAAREDDAASWEKKLAEAEEKWAAKTESKLELAEDKFKLRLQQAEDKAHADHTRAMAGVAEKLAKAEAALATMQGSQAKEKVTSKEAEGKLLQALQEMEARLSSAEVARREQVQELQAQLAKESARAEGLVKQLALAAATPPPAATPAPVTSRDAADASSRSDVASPPREPSGGAPQGGTDVSAAEHAKLKAEVAALEQRLSEERAAHEQAKASLAKEQQQVLHLQQQLAAAADGSSLPRQRESSHHSASGDRSADLMPSASYASSHSSQHAISPELLNGRHKGEGEGKEKKKKKKLAAVFTSKTAKRLAKINSMQEVLLAEMQSEGADREIALEELGHSAAELRNIVNLQSKELEHLKGQLANTTKLFEQVGIPTLFRLLTSEDVDIRRTAAKAVANLAAQDEYQQEIVAVGGLAMLFGAITESDDETTHRLAAGAIANLAMSEANQVAIVEQGGLPVLLGLAEKARDPQTARMVAGAVANLCGNGSIKELLVRAGALKAFLTMAEKKDPDILVQVARGFANFIVRYPDADVFIREGALPCLVTMVSSHNISVKKHSGLALYHLAQSEKNIGSIVGAGGLKLILENRRCEREDIRRLAAKTLLCLGQDEQVKQQIDEWSKAHGVGLED
eukprot:jgi/Mesvir1/23902/Mv10685-RA.1